MDINNTNSSSYNQTDTESYCMPMDEYQSLTHRIEDCSSFVLKQEKEINDLLDRVESGEDYFMELLVNRDVDIEELQENNDSLTARISELSALLTQHGISI